MHKRRRLPMRRRPPRSVPARAALADCSPVSVRHVKQRPVYLDLPRIRLPLPGIVSILHRVSGALLVFWRASRCCCARCAASLDSPSRYAAMKAAFAHPLAKLVLIALLWAYLHHFCAGIRYLLLDIHSGIELAPRAPVERRRARAEPRADADPRGAAVVTAPARRRRALRPHGLADPAAHRRRHGASTRCSCSRIALWNGGIDYPLWTELFAHGGFKLASFLFMVALLYHAWIGVRDILMDYIKPAGMRLAARGASPSSCSSPTSAGRCRSLWGRDRRRMTLPVRKFDAIVVGAGGAGMRASLQLAEAGLSVAVLSKVFPTRSHTVAAQGGIGAALGNMSEDSWLWHMYDTIKGSDWLGDQDAIEYMCRMAPQVVYELEHFGMPFDRNADGTIYQRPFGGHSANFGEKAGAARLRRRRPHRARAAAHALPAQRPRAHAVLRRVDGARPRFATPTATCWASSRWRWRPSEVVILQAKATLFATGGAGRIFAASTNAFINTGDGLGMAARAGIPLEDMEFWQFHPTGVAGAGVLITEGVRGEGGILLNCNGERFMERYAPNLKDLASRDVVEPVDGPGDQGRARLRSAQGLRAAEARSPRARRDHEAAAVDPRDRAQVRERRLHPGSRFRSCRRSTTRWAASRPTSTGRSWRRRTATTTRSSTVSTRSANARACRCTAPTGSARIR